MKIFGHAPHRVIAQASPKDIEGLIDTLHDADIIAEREPKRAMVAMLMAATITDFADELSPEAQRKLANVCEFYAGTVGPELQQYLARH